MLEFGRIESVYVSGALTPTPSSLTEHEPLKVQTAPSGKVIYQSLEPDNAPSSVNCVLA